MSFLRRIYPFNAEQTVNILSEFGPLVTMFVVNAAAGINAGTWALIVATAVAMIVMRMVLGRFPIFPIIASSVTITFGVMTLITKDPMWVQIKVSIFNAMFAGFLFGGLFSTSATMGRLSLLTTIAIVVVGGALQTPLVLHQHGSLIEQLGHAENPLFANLLCLGSHALGFFVGTFFKRNFFGYVFEKTFHYTNEGWDRFTFSFAWFFVFTAVMNEVVRQVFAAQTMYALPVLGLMNGVNIWILFKIAFIMPVSGIYAWYLTRLMQPYRCDVPDGSTAAGPTQHPPGGGGQAYATAQARGRSRPD